MSSDKSPKEPASPGVRPRVIYLIAEIEYGVGLTTSLAEVIRFGQGEWTSTVITPKLGTLPQTHPIAPVALQRRRYFLSLVDGDFTKELRHASIVHIINGLPYFPNAIASGTPLIYTLMQPDPTWLFNGIARVKRFANRVVENRWLLGRADALVSISPWVAEWYRKRANLDSIVITESFDLDVFRPASAVSGSPSRGVQLLCVGDWDGWNGRKRTHELIALMPQVARTFPTAGLRLVGLRPSSVDALRRLAVEFGVEERVSFDGKLTVERLVAAYQAATIYVAPTIVEGFYRPIIEAFACGLPAIARDARGEVEEVCQSPKLHVLESGGGLIYDGSADSLVEAIGRLLSTRDQFASSGLLYSKRFDRNVVLPRFRDLYRRLIRA